ncbi:tripartite tricarboxylate transporter TctB family protein [Alphaproteobacteria bacterium]|nr:tripartite tricarboxylate transporter TctB family protein [Alphaproteobacteria bacterium]
MNKHFFSGVFMLAVGLLLLLLLIPFGIDTPKKIRYAALSPTYYPQIVALILSVIGAAIIFRNRKSFSVKEAEELDVAHPNAQIRIIIFLALLAAYALSLEFLGFVLSGALALATSLILAGERRAIFILAMSLLLPISLFLFFYKVAYVPVPNGLLAPFIRWI